MLSIELPDTPALLSGDMGYQIIINSYDADKKYWRKRVWKGGGGGYKCQAICQLSVTVYMIIND